jgi:predicted TIM-barrel fold metal-dependent hydrolase
VKKRSFMSLGYVDAHVHVWEPADSRFPYDPNYGESPISPASFNPEYLLALAEAAFVKRIVLVQMSFYGTDNAYMMEAMRRHPSVFSGIVAVDHQAASLSTEMTRLASLGVRGLRITQGNRPDGWLETASMLEMWRLAAEKKLAICTLVGPDAIPALDRMCSKFPGTTVVIDHMARIGMDGTVRDRDVSALCHLSRHARVCQGIGILCVGKKASTLQRSGALGSPSLWCLWKPAVDVGV